MKLLKWLFGNRKPELNKPTVSSSCGCVISWGVGFYDVKEGKDITHNVKVEDMQEFQDALDYHFTHKLGVST